MATLTPDEFTEAVTALADHFGVEQLRNRLARLNAFTSQRGLKGPPAIAERLHRLSGGLRLNVPATYAFTSLWGEMVGAKMGEGGENKLEEAANQVNACLADDNSIVAGKESELDQALAVYREAVSSAVGARVATLDMLLKAVPAVAERLRNAPSPSPPAE